MTTYYRFTNSNNPMSDWGHAMFAEDRYQVENYGKNEFTIDSDKTVSIWDLRDEIIVKWDECREIEDFGPVMTDRYLIDNVTGEQAFESFNPDDIVDSAQGYDTDWVCWLWELILEPAGIMAVRTQNGVVCFDENLIEKVA
jgi:hypothetical protein